MPSLTDFIRKLQDAEYERSANAMLSAIGQMTKGQGAEIQTLLVALEKQAKQVTDAGKLVSSEVYSEMLAQFRGDMNKVERLIKQTAPDIELSGARAANNSVTARLFYGTSQDMIDAGIDPTSAEAMAYFMGLVKDVGIPFKVPKPEDLVTKYSQSEAFFKHMDKWGDGYADYFDGAIQNGLVSGWGAMKTARYIRGMAENIPLNAAYMWTRTLQLQSYRDASAQMETLNGRFIEKKIRIAALDAFTCPACIALHGTEVPKGQAIKDHYNGRCDAIYIPYGSGMPEYMQAMSEPGKRQFTEWQNGTDWFDAQSDAYKQQVLGKGRFELYQQGKFKLDADFVNWHDDDVFGIMPGAKPLWMMQGYGSYAEKVASSAETAFDRLVKDFQTRYPDIIANSPDSADLNAIFSDYINTVLTDAQREAIEGYTGMGYATINGYLRGTYTPPITKYHDKNIGLIKKSFDNAPLIDRDMVVFRGINEQATNLGIEAGKPWIDKGFMSTSIDKDVAFTRFGGKNYGTLFEIYIPEGSKGAMFVEGLSSVASEKELLLNAGSQFYILDATSSKASGEAVYYVRAIYLGGL